MKRTIIKYALLAIVGLLLAASYWLFKTERGHYAFCLMNEARWMKAHTQSDLEAMLWNYNSQTISPTQSAWGHFYQLNNGETMVQYLILKDPTCPLDVVYSSDGKIQALFTSYE